jgi:uncharacterized protein with PQ loop repeat|tara:strand:- start:317 stop:601 length:285 start_codon:yes stop_codon:yes gene_type:complete
MIKWVGYLGLFFATIYRLPQILKIYRTKRGGDVSKKSFLLHNCAYISFIFYLLYGKKEKDYILLVYYFIGMTQNIIIVALKKYYKTRQLEENAL